MDVWWAGCVKCYLNVLFHVYFLFTLYPWIYRFYRRHIVVQMASLRLLITLLILWKETEAEQEPVPKIYGDKFYKEEKIPHFCN